MLPHDLGHGLGADQVVDDGGPGVSLEHHGGDHGRDGRAGERLGPLVDQEHPVGVTVEGQAHVGAGLEHPGLEVLEVLGLDGVGGVVGERPVQLGIQELEVEGQAREHPRHHQPAHAVGHVGHHPQGAQHREVDEGADVVGEGVENVPGADAAPASVGRRRTAPGHRGLDLPQAGVLAHGAGAGQAQLDPVVGGGVMRGREHGPGGVQPSRGEVDHVGRGQAQVDHVRALRRHALGEGARQLDSAGSHVARHQDGGRTGEAGEGSPHRPAQPGVELVGNRAADVVGLVDVVENGHRRRRAYSPGQFGYRS